MHRSLVEAEGAVAGAVVPDALEGAVVGKVEVVARRRGTPKLRGDRQTWGLVWPYFLWPEVF